MRSYVTELTNSRIKSTMGVDIGVKKLKIENGKLTIQIWDLAGDDHFRSLFPVYLRGASAGIFMYDITRLSTIKKMDDWLISLKNQFNGENKIIPILVIGGKLDLHEKREVTIENVIKLSKSYKIHDFIECSAKNSQRVNEIFNLLIDAIMSNEGFI